MEMITIEDSSIGEDLTPPLPPIAAVLRDSAVASYCSACFSPLPPHPIPPLNPSFPHNSRHVPFIDTLTPLYCSHLCSSVDSPLHFSSGENHLLYIIHQSPPSTVDESSDLRLSLRLLQKLSKDYNFSQGARNFRNQRSLIGENVERIGGLMTNREKLLIEENMNPNLNCDSKDWGEIGGNVSETIKEGAMMMAKARRRMMMYPDEDVTVEKLEDFSLEEMVVCLVMTNAVEVQDKNGFCIGIAVYDTAFSWINHSCSPNACYRFVTGNEDCEHRALRITPASKNGCDNVYGNGG